VAASSEPIEGLFPAFLHYYAKRHPAVQMVLVEADAAEHMSMLERGEVHVAATVVNVIPVDANRFTSYPLPSFHVRAAFARSLGIADGDTIDIRRLAEYPLLLPRVSFATRILFDAACRLAGLKPKVFIESASPHALLALAEEGHGVAIVPSIVRMQRRPLLVSRVTHKREPLRIAPAILWDRRRTLPRYAEAFAELLTAYILEVFPSTGAGRAATERTRSGRAQRA
jgi:DNA-binding transcriptional LysR family regulator